MTERSIIEAAARLRRQRENNLVATVVSVRGSAYRRPGARMLLTQFRWIAGSVSGGCLEGDIASKGWWRTQGGEPALVTYDSRVPEDADDDDLRAAFGLGCDGVVEVLLERAGTPGKIDPLALAETCLRQQRRGAIATVFRSTSDVKVGTRCAIVDGGDAFGDQLPDAVIMDMRTAVESGQSCSRAYGAIEVFIEAIVPPPRLFVFGTGHDALPVVQLARQLGWDVSVCASQARVSTRQRFTGADEILVGSPAEIAARIDECDRPVAVVMSHNFELDQQSVRMLVGTRVRYVGVLGPRSRTQCMVGEQPDPRIHAPVGLELGAETPHEIALAIVAEIQSVIAKVPAGSLRDRIGPIHDRPLPRVTDPAGTGPCPVPAVAA